MTIDRTNYQELLIEVKERIRSAQYAALKAVNHELIALYWDIGRLIVYRQQTAGWGKSIVEQLAQDIQSEFPGISGFSVRNLWNMRNFHLTYSQDAKLQPLVAEIGWTHNLVILEKCKDDLEREFYLRMTRKFGWTKNVLIHQIDDRAYQKTLLKQTNFDNTLNPEISQQAKLAIKDEYTFDFLELGDAHSERQLEQAILSRVEPFLQEMGGMFTFVGSQYRLTVAGQEYFLDLLLYHRHLKCLIAVELKVGEFLPEYVGKMQFYLAILDDTVRLPDENPAIGIILCKTKDRTIVEYALRESNKPIGVTTYQIVSTLPQEFQGQLPDPTQIAQLLAGINQS
jgi:predicted nuclease of restriction endonuclease-like (RecB) superfamily